MTRFAALAAFSMTLAAPALAHDGRCGTESPRPGFQEPTTASEGLAFSIDLIQWTVDWSLDLSEAFGAPVPDRAEIDQAMASLDELVALVASMESWGTGEGWTDAPAAKPGAKRKKAAARAKRA